MFANVKTIKIDHPRLRQFVRNYLGAGLAPVCVPSYQKLKPHGNCYWNVAVKIQENGGSVVYGWQIEFWPKYYIVATHHAVWRDPSGKLYDVTEKKETAKNLKYTTFVIDDSIKIDLEKTNRIDNVFEAFSDLEQLKMLFYKCNEVNQLARELGEVGWKYGYRSQNNWELAKTGVQGDAPEVDGNYLSEATPIHEKLIAAEQSFNKLVDSLHVLDSLRR